MTDTVKYPVKKTYYTEDLKASITWELRQAKKGIELSVTGKYDGSSGAGVAKRIAEAYPDDPFVQRLSEIAEKYHLNGMNAGTEGHYRSGCGHGKTKVIIWEELNDIQKKAIEDKYQAEKDRLKLSFFNKQFKKDLERALRRKESWVNFGLASDFLPSSIFSGLIFFGNVVTSPEKLAEVVTDWLREEYYLNKLKKALKNKEDGHYQADLSVERYKKQFENMYYAVREDPRTRVLNPYRTLATDLRRLKEWCAHLEAVCRKKFEEYASKKLENYQEPEICKNSLGYPCPDTGKLYGHELFFHPIPEDILNEILSWEDSTPEFAESGDSPSDIIVRKWMQEKGIEVSSRRVCWVEEREQNKFALTITCGGKSKDFDYYGGSAVKEDAFSFFRGILMEAFGYQYDTFEEFCMNMGYDTDSRSAYKTFEDLKDLHTDVGTLLEVDYKDLPDELKEALNDY
jgi:hypothetical protein